MKERPEFYSDESKVPAGAVKLNVVERAHTELFFVEHPNLRKDAPEVEAQLSDYLKNHTLSALWVYFPWRNTAIHIPNEETYFKLRTARNRNLITESEQLTVRAKTVGIAGLSVGSSVVTSLVATAGPKTIKLADPDTIDITNLNRINATLLDVGENKTTTTAKRAWELDPFLDLQLHEDGVTNESLPSFVSNPKLGVFIDEMDAIALKIESRDVCKRFGVPVVMATDNGDSVIVDVERFDLEPDRPIFHGRVDITAEELSGMNRDMFVKLANRIIDPAYFTERQQKSIMEIGKTLSGVPQLSTAATIAGSAVSFVVRRILLGEDMPSGRYVISCEESFIQNYNGIEERAKRDKGTEAFKAHFGE